MLMRTHDHAIDKDILKVGIVGHRLEKPLPYPLVVELKAATEQVATIFSIG